MSNILAVETSSTNCSVALLKAGQVFEVTEDAPREHTRKLLPMIDALLSEHKMALGDLDAIAYGCGPGSFTGLRICLGVVQGLAYGQDLPLIPVSSLAAIAAAAVSQCGAEGQCRGQLLVANDARMNEVYACLYRFDGAVIEPLTEEQVCTPELLWEQSQLRALADDFIAVGDGWDYSQMAEVLDQRFDGRASLPIKATAGAMLPIAAEKFQRGEVVAAEESEPTYLRDSVAWKKRQRIRSN